jgi:hypothetical protein
VVPRLSEALHAKAYGGQTGGLRGVRAAYRAAAVAYYLAGVELCPGAGQRFYRPLGNAAFYRGPLGVLGSPSPSRRT